MILKEPALSQRRLLRAKIDVVDSYSRLNPLTLKSQIQASTACSS